LLAAVCELLSFRHKSIWVWCNSLFFRGEILHFCYK
jgi:hypothetical protein